MNAHVHVIAQDRQNGDMDIVDHRIDESSFPILVLNPLELSVLTFHRNEGFQIELLRGFRVFLDESALQGQVHFVQVSPYRRLRHEVEGLTTSPLAQIVRAPRLEWQVLSSEDKYITYEVARAFLDDQPIPLEVTAMRASLGGLPYVSAHGVSYVDNCQDGESGYNRESNLQVGRLYSDRVIRDSRLGRFVSSRRMTSHSNLLRGLASGLGWCVEFTGIFFTLMARALIDLNRFIRDQDREDDYVEYILEDLQALQIVIKEYKTSSSASFIGDLHVAQSFGRWLKILYDIDIFIITPLGCASMVQYMHDDVVILAWEPTSRMWTAWSRKHAPFMEGLNMYWSVTIPEWECFVRTWSRDHDEAVGTSEITYWRTERDGLYSCPSYAWNRVYVSPASGRWVSWLAELFPLLGNVLPTIGIHYFDTQKDFIFSGKFYDLYANGYFI